MTVPELSIVIPCFNEQENVAAICQAVIEQAEQHLSSFEIILIDNRSTDDTRAIIRELCAQDPRIGAIFNNRNYGQMRSPTHGIYQARGAAVIGMCADFQDPPELIGEFVRLWKAGAPIIVGQRRSEPTGWMLGSARAMGYGLLRRFADYPAIPNVTGFGLFDRQVVDTLARWHEPEPFFRGMLVESGFPITVVPFDRPPRAAGESKNGFATLFSFGVSALASSARSLLRLPILLGLLLTVIAVIMLFGGIAALILGQSAGLLLLAALMLIMFAILFLFTGLLGDQVRLLAERARGAPLVIEEERINLPSQAAA